MASTPTPSMPAGNRPTPDGDAALFRYRFDNVDFDESTNVLQVAGTAVPVEPLPLQLLGELLRRPNEVVTRAELFQALWDGRPTVDHVLANAVAKLRRALGHEAAARIVNLPRVGYRFAGTVERIAVGRRPAASVAFTVGQAVPGRDDFRFERALGSPGAAPHSVWLARNAKLQVARVFKFAADGERLAALKREYTVYRVLRHELGERDDFAEVVGVNFAHAPYFIECKYGGEDLQRWAAEGNHLAALNTAERIALFLQIARAVAAAHSVGVLHKDLKPANVLIDAGADGWVARLTDFGISRLLDPEQLARLGVTAMGMTVTSGASLDSPAGTLLYLAPELLAGQSPTMRSDLYALGLILYQLLVGDFRRPISTGWEREIDDALLREDIAAATQGQPENRLSNVNDLVERLHALDERRAKRAEATDAAKHAAALTAQVLKLRARRPWAVAAIASLSLGLAASLWFYSQANAAQRRAEQESARAQAINDFMNKDVLQSVEVTRDGTRQTVSIFDVLQRASKQAGVRFAGQPATEASVRHQLAELDMHVGCSSCAVNELSRAAALLKPIVARDDPLLLTVRFDLARAMTNYTQFDDARRELSLAEQDAGPQRLAGDSPLAFSAARAKFNLLMHLMQNQDALPVGMRALRLADSATPADTRIRGAVRRDLAELYVRLGDQPHADALLAELTAAPFDIRNAKDLVYGRARRSMGDLYLSEGKVQEAEREFIAARDALTRALGVDEVQVGMASHELGLLYESQGDFDKSVAAFSAAKSTFIAALGPSHPFTIAATGNFIAQRLNQGHAAEALQAFKVAGYTDQRINFARAQALSDLGRWAEALALLETVDGAEMDANSANEHDGQWAVKAEKGRALLGLGRTQEGIALLRDAVPGLQSAGAFPWRVARYTQLLLSVRANR